jgi:hypothetical protein
MTKYVFENSEHWDQGFENLTKHESHVRVFLHYVVMNQSPFQEVPLNVG